MDNNPLKNLWQVTDLRNRVLFTLAMLGVYRIGNHIPTPGVNQTALALLAEQRLISGINKRLKVLGRGEIGKALTVRAHKFSGKAAEKIAAAGGATESLP